MKDYIEDKEEGLRNLFRETLVREAATEGSLFGSKHMLPIQVHSA